MIDFKKYIIYPGALIGLGLSLLFIALYFISLELYVSPLLLLTTMVVTIGGAAVYGRKYKAAHDGEVSYLHMWLVMAGIAAVITLVFTGVEIVLYKVIDPEMPQKIEDHNLALLERHRINLTDDQYETQKDITLRMAESFSIYTNLAVLLFKVIGFSIVTAFAAIFVRK